MHGSAKGAVIRRNLFTLYQKKLEPLLRLSLPILPAVPASYTRSADGHHLCAIPPFSAFAFACIDWSAAFPRVALRLNYRKKQRFSRTRLARIILLSINKTVKTTTLHHASRTSLYHQSKPEPAICQIKFANSSIFPAKSRNRLYAQAVPIFSGHRQSIVVKEALSDTWIRNF